MAYRTLSIAGVFSVIMCSAALACPFGKMDKTAHSKSEMSTIAEAKAQPVQSKIADAGKSAHFVAAQKTVEATPETVTDSSAEPVAANVAQSGASDADIAKPKS